MRRGRGCEEQHGGQARSGRTTAGPGPLLGGAGLGRLRGEAPPPHTSTHSGEIWLKWTSFKNYMKTSEVTLNRSETSKGIYGQGERYHLMYTWKCAG